MHLSFWRPSLAGRIVAKRLVASAGVLALVVGLLTTSTLFTRPAAAAPGQQHSTTVSLSAQDGTTPRLGVFESDGMVPDENGQGVNLIWYRWSDDNGANWSGYYNLGKAPPQYGSISFVHRPAVVSDGPGRLLVVARDQDNQLWENDCENGCSDNTWDGWQNIGSDVLQGSEHWDFISDPALTSWGPGRWDMFVYVKSEATGVMRLFHGWGENYTPINTSRSEMLGTSIDLQGNPAAVSWGPGRIDIFGRDAVNHLAHKWYDASTGGWHNWEDLGGNLASSPTVGSGGVGGWDVYVLNQSRY